MAQLVVAAAGAVVGSFIPGVGTMAGWAIGSAIGGMLFPAKGPKQPAQALMDLRVTGTEYGQQIPWVRGKRGVAGQMWWNSDRRPITTTTTTGGKGGEPEVEQTSTTYEMDVLYGLTDNEGIGIARIWDNGKLIWINDALADAGSLEASALTERWARMTVYTGNAAQLPDPTYEAAVGSANATAYRGRVTCFIQGLQLGQSGQVPNLTFEVVMDGAISGGDFEEDDPVFLFSDSDGANFEVHGLLNGWKFDPDVLSEGELWLPYANNADWFTRLDPLTGAYIGDAGPKTPITNSTPPQSMTTDVAGGYTYIVPGIAAPQHIYGVEHSTQLTSKDLNVGTSTRLGEVAINPYTGLLYVTCSTSGASNIYSRLREVDKVTGSFGVSIQPYGNDLNGLSYPLFDSSGLYAYFTTIDGTSIVRVTLLTGATSTYNVTTPAAVDEIFATIYDETNNALWMTGYIYSPDFLVVTVVWNVATQTVTAVIEEPALDGGADTYAEPVLYDQYRNVVWVYISDFSDENLDPRVGDFDYLAGFSLADFSLLHTINVSTFGGDVDDDDIVDWAVGEAGLYVQQYVAATFDHDFWLVPFTESGGTIAAVCPTLEDVVEEQCLRSGMSASHFDVTGLSTITKDVCSFNVSQVAPVRQAIEALMATHFFEMTMSDKVYFRPRGGSSVATIPYLDLGATAGADQPEPLALKQSNELEIPAHIAVTYSNIDDDYQTDTQPSDRLITATSETTNTVTISHVAMTPAEAKAIADVMALDMVVASVGTSIALLGDYSRLEPTDPVTVIDADSSQFRLRLVKKKDSYPLLEYEAVLDDVSILTSQGITSADYNSSTVVAPPIDTLMELMDIPILIDADNNAGLYVATKGATDADYPGAAVFDSPDDVEFQRRVTINESAVFGECTTTLGDWTGTRVIDELNSVTVDVGDGTLSSSTRDAVLDSQAVNAMLIGDELLQFITATLTAPGVYVLTRLLRGGRGTEWAMTGHAASERCVLLRQAGIRRIILQNNELGIERYYKAVTLGRALSTATSEPFTNNAIGLKPFSPFDLRMDRDGSNNITGTFQRRTRLSVRMIGALGISVPLGEEDEDYEIDIYDDGTYTTVVRTIETDTTTFSYSAAEQTADGLTPGDPVYAHVHQMSEAVGRGYALEAVA